MAMVQMVRRVDTWESFNPQKERDVEWIELTEVQALRVVRVC